MFACKVFLAVALVMSANFIQINGRPADTDWAKPFESALKNLTLSMNELVGADNSKYSDLAKTSYNDFVNSFNTGLTSLSKSFEGKAGASELVKDAAKQWQEAVDNYSKKQILQDLAPAQFTEKFEKSLKYITEHATELSKKAQGNAEIEKEIREFTKTTIDNLMKQVESVKSKLNKA